MHSTTTLPHQPLIKGVVKSILRQKPPLYPRHSGLNTALCITLCILFVRSIGLLQSLEFAALDQFFRLRPNETLPERITIVAIDEDSLRQVGSWPIPDRVIAQLLEKIRQQQPRAIGLDIYRDFPVQPGYDELVKAYKLIPNLIGIQLLGQQKNTSVLPPPVLSQLGQVGFNNVLYDSDGKVRRSLLYWHLDQQIHESFALKLALLYLKSAGITPQKAANNPEYLQLGKAVFTRFQNGDGAYVGVDARGYQILANFPQSICEPLSSKSCSYRYVSLQDVLADRVPGKLFANRIVLIGSTAPSLQDFVLIPYSSRLMGTAKPVAGIELQAYFINELITAALEGKPLLKVWNKLLEYLWIFTWSYLGSFTRWQIRHPASSVINILFASLLLILSAYYAFIFGWWIPVIPPLLTFTCSTIWITSHIAYTQEEMKRSKEFLHEVFNTIPDPIFVKNEKFQWIVLNDAYCQFIGYPHDLLMEKSVYDIFPLHEADVFHAQEQLVFQTQQPQENEEEFTDAQGKTYLIATKRSLHKDAAGNLFLVGVIRDITQRKQQEIELKRTASELFRSNNELKLKEDYLRFLAYHDPLTGLCNRKFFTEQLRESLNWAKNNHLLLGLLFIDLDGFKGVNDTLGHEIGDRLLVSIADRLSNSLRANDIVSRWGGDEFTVMIPSIPNVQVAAKVAEKLLSIITEPVITDGHIVKVSASIGISIYPINSQDSETLIKQADTAMYLAKQLGKNRYEFAV
jgi:diguanylate cyclase (GGDEF)-like protein/PAS domain S-box-containing protein